MKVKVGYYDLSISGKYDLDKNYTERETMALLNEISLVYSLASEHIGGAMGEDFRRKADDIYRFLLENGCYK